VPGGSKTGAFAASTRSSVAWCASPKKLYAAFPAGVPENSFASGIEGNNSAQYLWLLTPRLKGACNHRSHIPGGCIGLTVRARDPTQVSGVGCVSLAVRRRRELECPSSLWPTRKNRVRTAGLHSLPEFKTLPGQSVVRPRPSVNPRVNFSKQHKALFLARVADAWTFFKKEGFLEADPLHTGMYA